MTTVPGYAGEEKRYTFMVPPDSESVASNEPKPELGMNPFRIVEMAIEIQLEKLRVAEAMSARDVLVQKLSDAYTSIREKTETIERLQQTINATANNGNVMSKVTPPSSALSQETPDQITEITELRSQVANLEALVQNLRIGSRNAIGPPPKYEEEERRDAPLENYSTLSIFDVQTTSPLANIQAVSIPVREERSVQTSVLEEPEDMVNARFAILASIPLPGNPPDDTLKPIVLPPTCTLHEFLSSTSGTLRNLLGNYRVLQSLTTKWCPTREEHGYFYSPLFKCSTNPRVTTAHRWQQVDVTARMKHPTECFYNRDGLWYYAGSYRAFRLEDLTVREWAELPTETANYLVKDTISGRRNVSPQNIYEVNQLYNAGALKIACVGLQCVGFNQEVYKSVLDHAAKFTQAKWKSPAATAMPMADTNHAITAPSTGTNAETGAPSNINKQSNAPIKSSAGASRSVSPTLLGSTNIAFGAVAAGLGLGNGTTWNTTATLLTQGNN